MYYFISLGSFMSEIGIFKEKLPHRYNSILKLGFLKYNVLIMFNNRRFDSRGVYSISMAHNDGELASMSKRSYNGSGCTDVVGRTTVRDMDCGL